MFKTIKTSKLIAWLISPAKEVLRDLVEIGLKTRSEINDMSRVELNVFVDKLTDDIEAEIDRRIPVPSAS
jgi:hypothetical protein